MKKLILLFGAMMLLAGISAKAQTPQPPAKKATTKPVTTVTPKPAAVNAYLPIDGRPGPSTSTTATRSKHPVAGTGNATVVTNPPRPATIQPVNKPTKRTRP